MPEQNGRPQVRWIADHSSQVFCNVTIEVCSDDYLFIRASAEAEAEFELVDCNPNL